MIRGAQIKNLFSYGFLQVFQVSQVSGILRAGLEKVLYPGILVTSQFAIWQPILWLGKAKPATI